MKTTKPAVKKTPAKKASAKTAQTYPSKELQSMIPQLEVVHELPKELADKPVELTFADIEHCRQILEVCSSRGAFRANEMILVGETYNRLAEFLRQQNGQTN